MNNGGQNMAKNKALAIITLLGLVSLFADVTYEGARGVTGPFLYTLGATAGLVGLVSGVGELFGYGLRLVSGYVADKTRKYWAITILGYFINLVSVPLLAFAGRWEIASILIVAERFGKAIRTPARDTILSYASSKIGFGKGFGLHEALDQIGAIAGPLIVAGAISTSKSYSNAFLILGIPAAISLIFLLITSAIYPKPEGLESENNKTQNANHFSKTFYLYLLFTAFTICGFPHFQIISFHLKKIQLVSDEIIPLMFAFAMGVDAIVALIIGPIFDRFRSNILFLIPLVSAPIVVLAFAFNKTLPVMFSVFLWGSAMGLQETIMKSAIADIIHPEKRARAFGIFHGLYGFAWFAGSFVMGLLYEVSIYLLITFSLVLQALSLITFLQLKRT
jgi:MFS family permease